ncbi:MAG: hypothetical protein WD696_08660 [Bryobacteraceae bacterium]
MPCTGSGSSIQPTSGAKPAAALEPEFDDVEVVTTEDVLVEVLNAMSGAGAILRRTAVNGVQAILEDENVRVMGQSHEGFLEGLELYAKRPDKGYSHTDCVSMIEMRRLRIRDVLSADRHFQQEGFTTLLVSGGR